MEAEGATPPNGPPVGTPSEKATPGWSQILRWIDVKVRGCVTSGITHSSEVSTVRSDASLRVLRKLDGFDRDGTVPLEYWVKDQTRYAAMEARRQSAKRYEREHPIAHHSALPVESIAADPADQPEVAALRSERLAACKHCIRQLPHPQHDRFQVSIWLREVKMTQRVFAEILEIPLVRLKESLRSARIFLRKCFERAGI